MAHETGIAKMLETIHLFHNESEQFRASYKNQPKSPSLAEIEMSSIVRSDSGASISLKSPLTNAYSQGSIFVTVIADHLLAFAKTIVEPIQTVAPWNCARATLESSALACWILDPTIDAKERSIRSFALRYDGLSQQMKIARARGDSKSLANVEKRLKQVESSAISFGIQRAAMPSFSSLTKDVLDEEVNYRLFSAIVHAHTWALSKLSFQPADAPTIQYDIANSQDASLRIFEKGIDETWVAILCFTVFINFAKSVWFECQMFGWDTEQLKKFLNKASLSMKINENKCFWKKS